MAIDEPLMSEFGRLPDHPAIRPDCILCCRGNSSTHVWLEQVGISRSIPFSILEYSTDAHGKWSAGPPPVRGSPDRASKVAAQGPARPAQFGPLVINHSIATLGPWLRILATIGVLAITASSLVAALGAMRP